MDTTLLAAIVAGVISIVNAVAAAIILIKIQGVHTIVNSKNDKLTEQITALQLRVTELVDARNRKQVDDIRNDNESTQERRGV